MKENPKKRDGEYDVTGRRRGAKVMYFGLCLELRPNNNITKLPTQYEKYNYW